MNSEETGILVGKENDIMFSNKPGWLSSPLSGKHS